MKLTRSSLKELIRQSIKEMDFKDEEAFEKYKSKHKMRPSTKVSIGGKDTTVGDLDYNPDDDMGDLMKQIDQDPPRDASDDYELYKQGAKDTIQRMKDIKSGKEDWNDIADSEEEAMEYLKGELEDHKRGMKGDFYDSNRKESVKESKKRKFDESTTPTYLESWGSKKTTVKEIKKWMKTLEENRYKKTYNSDCRRVAWLVNNNLSEDYESMPVSMRKKWSKAAYGRERQLAKEFLKHKVAEQKLRESIRNIVKGLITEGMYGEEDSFIPLRVDKYAPNTRLGLKNTIESLEGAAYGFSLSEDSEMDYPDAADAAHEAYNKWAKGMGTKLQKLYKELSKGWEIYDKAFEKERKKSRK